MPTFIVYYVLVKLFSPSCNFSPHRVNIAEHHAEPRVAYFI